MVAHRVRYGIVSAGLAGGAAVAAAMLGMAVAHADDSTDEINGWAVTPTGDSSSTSPLLVATLSDPSNSLGLGTDPITGSFGSVAATPLSDIGSNESFATPLSSAATDNLFIQDNWFPGFEIASVQAGQDDAVMSLLVPDAGGNQVVDLFNFGTPDPAPLFNPDATGPIDVGGVELASPDAGALFNDLGAALFTGDATAWSNATTLLDDIFGIDPSGAADAVDPSSLLPDLGF